MTHRHRRLSSKLVTVPRSRAWRQTRNLSKKYHDADRPQLAVPRDRRCDVALRVVNDVAFASDVHHNVLNRRKDSQTRKTDFTLATASRNDRFGNRE